MPTVNLDHDSQTIVARGREAWKNLKADDSWEKWVAIGRAIEAGKSAIMRFLNTNQSKGRAWSETFGQWLRENEFDQIDKGVKYTIANLSRQSARNRSMAADARVDLALAVEPPERGIAALAGDTQAPAKRNGAPTGNRKDAAIMQLQDELDAAQRELRQLKKTRDDLTEGRDWHWQDAPEDIAKAMLRLYPDKAKRLGSALQNLCRNRPARNRAQRKPERTESRARRERPPAPISLTVIASPGCTVRNILQLFLRGVKSFGHPAHNRIGNGQADGMALMRPGNDDLGNLRRT